MHVAAGLSLQALGLVQEVVPEAASRAGRLRGNASGKARVKVARLRRREVRGGAVAVAQGSPP